MPFDGAIHTNTIGFSGGLWLLWNSDFVEVELLAKTEQEIHIEVQVCNSNLTWLFSAIYANPRSEERSILWDNLAKVAELHKLLWVMAGDFNEPLIDEDKFGGRGVNINRSLAFKDCLDRCSMVDLGFSGPRYTWTNKRDISNLILERIDRFFMNPDGCVMYPNARVIDAMVSTEEIKEALWSMNPYKAPGPDGLHAGFFQRFWLLVGDSVRKEVEKAFTDRKVPEYLNNTHIVLIPKIQGPETIGNYRPISLCNSVYKIITKILVARIRPHLDKLVSPHQTAFVPGRRGVDNAIIVQELIHTIGRAKGSRGIMAIKIDLEKAYDIIEWSFIREMLILFNFPENLIKLIMSCITSVSTSLLLNGGSLDPFLPSRGIRQGDPLSPYLFILCMEFLGHLIEGKCAAKLWTPVKASRSGPAFSHLFFADDLVLFASATPENCSVISSVLQEFCNKSGQKVSEAKSRVFFSPNVDLDQRDALSSILGFRATTNLCKYLGFPIKHPGRQRHDFGAILDRVKKKLAGWKANMLSMAGRMVLIQASSSAIPSYVMQSNLLPNKVLSGIDRVNRNFLWGSSEHKKKMHWVNWDTVTKPKELGGLGIQSARGRNTALLAKLNWRFHIEKDSQWARVLRFKYGSRQRINSRNESKLPSGPIRSSIQGPLPQGSASLTLKDLHAPHGWNWATIPFDIPSEIKADIQAVPVPAVARCNDKLAWKFSAKGSFDMKSAYFLATDQKETNSFSGSWIWKLQSLPRIQMFIWRCMRNSIGVKECLARRGISLDISCPLCLEQPESITHALRDCRLVKPQRNQVVFNNKGVNPNISNLIIRQATKFVHCVTQPRCNSRMIIRQIKWEKPNTGWVKLNTDGSTDIASGTTGGGGLIRDDRGSWIMGFTRKISKADSFLAETWALRDGLLLCNQHNFNAVMIELDAKALVDALNNPSYTNIIVSSLFDDCRLLAAQIPQLSIKHIYREANKCADRLAKLGSCQDVDFISYSYPPVELLPLVVANCQGMVVNRFCPDLLFSR
ncbi:uncharacterized protein LOC136071559 [Quercus suber]|uniref:uncharacterized protein LOC136071559 n=1 Tax=Quercus suber TaxID=58331 RepID=UPI0032E04C45